jgi:hypothetical protein
MRLPKTLVPKTLVPKTLAFPTLVFAAALVAHGIALAQGGGPVRAACQSDIRALCGAVQPGGGRIRDCMREHRAELSAACKIALADRMLEHAGHRQNAGAPGVINVPGK